jgi:hypothetical protein
MDLIPSIGRIPLSVVIDLAAQDGPRDAAFVGRFCAWLHAHASGLRLAIVTQLGLADVVLTFRMQDHVALVITGTLPDAPGEVTVHIHERDFPFVELLVGRNGRATPDWGAPYEICTLDYAVTGRPLVVTRTEDTARGVIPAGTRGEAVVAATVSGRREIRARLRGHEHPVTLAEGSFRWLG